MKNLKLSLAALLMVAGISTLDAGVSSVTSAASKAAKNTRIYASTSKSSSKITSPLSTWNMLSKNGKEIGKVKR